jgi:signal transduction histidine kinase
MIKKNDVNPEVSNLFSQHSEQIQNYILDATAVCFGIFDLEGKVLALNQGFKDILDPGSDYSNIKASFINPTFDFFIQQSESKNQPLIYEGLLTIGSELRNKSFKTRTIKYFSGLLFLCEYDVNELDYINNEMQSLNQKLNDSQHQLIRKKKALTKSISDLKLAQSKLVESEKMASLGRLVAGFAHEINTPIGIALTASSSVMESSQHIEQMLIQDEVEEDDLISTPETIRDASKLVFSNLNRSADLVGSFKRTSIDQSATSLSRYCLNDTIADVLTSMRIKIKNTSIKTVFNSHENINLYGIPGDIVQVISNMFENSVLHGFDNGKLEGVISIAVKKEENDIHIHYSDTGKGMSPETLERIFEPFYTTLRARGGTGLGMYICHNIVTTRLKGTIECDSTQGKGVEFSIIFPITKAGTDEAYKIEN